MRRPKYTLRQLRAHLFNHPSFHIMGGVCEIELEIAARAEFARLTEEFGEG